MDSEDSNLLRKPRDESCALTCFAFERSSTSPNQAPEFSTMQENNRERKMAKAQELENFGHQHPLLRLSEELNNQNGEPMHSCARCGKVAPLSNSDPCLGCVDCGFYLHQKCADAPLEINHPFHSSHPIVLLQNSPYPSTCDFCDEICEFFVYHCFCGLYFHIKCALFTYDIAENNLKEPFPLKENEGEKHERNKCFGCWEPLVDSAYLTLDSGFPMHKSCAELPFKINLMCHRKHPLILQFNSERLSCNVCKITEPRGFIYCCLPCKFAVHIQCASPSPVVENESHPHPFTMIWRQCPFICDACGTEGNYVMYICSTCNIFVHKNCISVPCFIKSRWHHHYLAHRYFIAEQDYSISWDCMICHDEVNIEHGSYYCSDCKKVAHVICALKKEEWYYIVSPENEDKNSLLDDIDPIIVIERNDVGEATKINHFKHTHDLVLSYEIVEYECCDGCMLAISGSFYYCSECDFFLHKKCAELPKMKQIWYHDCEKPLNLTSDYIFRCETCDYLSHGFAYQCKSCVEDTCLRCVTLSPDSVTCEGHEHPLLFYYTYEGECRACGNPCGGENERAYYCKGCNFALHCRCILLPSKARHKCDKHILKLTYLDNNDYSESYYCDICEEKRDPHYGFYHCAICDTSAHINCVLGKYSFIKPGSIYKVEDHPHPLTFVKNSYYYPDCIKCGKSCQDLALECSAPACNYIVHWECIAPPHLSK